MTRHETPDPRAGRAVAGMRPRARAIHGLVVAALAAALALLGLAAPAAAHGGPIVISVGTDGAGGITANLTYHNDGHPVEESADVSVTAVSDTGESVGPVALRSASEGVGWYVSDPGLLAEGHWTLTATMTTPAEATATAEVDVVPLPEPPSDDTAGSGDPAGDAQDAAGDVDDAGATAGATTAGRPPPTRAPTTAPRRCCGSSSPSCSPPRPPWLPCSRGAAPAPPPRVGDAYPHRS
ncbi:hypothetical protein [Cellulosimicrobium sp. CUA-896]|uniref:hypothetical protein n=1 Tax=Cellulosimicrobium sp. CUA-896 TaxID=1517881 RepID=UPI000964F354|nr:hypothetical protein [Cellulosimicrobium sp. CUA-896]OLT45553.1 hypothetical protein BJF88_05925 [Cellulosimicrobium sp. CUA-896]